MKTVHIKCDSVNPIGNLRITDDDGNDLPAIVGVKVECNIDHLNRAFIEVLVADINVTAEPVLECLYNDKRYRMVEVIP